MSRIGLSPVSIPDDVKIEIVGREMTAKGKVGELSLTFVEEVEPSIDGDKLWFRPTVDTIKARKLWGTYRSLAQNVVTGVSQGFTRVLDINGVGYRAAIKGKNLNLQLGHSHDINFPIPGGIKIDCPSQTEVVITGLDKQLVGSVAAKIRSFRPPEPYKGKGVKYREEQIVRKEGKKK
mgnify:CR=1 FL=1